MIRLVVAVVLTVALLGVSLPALEEGRVSRTDALVGAELDSFEAAATTLRRANDPVPPGRDGARRLVTVHVPGPSWTTARTTLRLGTGTGATDGVAWSRAGTTRTRRLSVPVRAVEDGTLQPDGTPLTLGPGSHRLALGLVRVDGQAVVTVRRFKAGNATSAAHVHRP